MKGRDDRTELYNKSSIDPPIAPYIFFPNKGGGVSDDSSGFRSQSRSRMVDVENFWASHP